MNKGFIGMAFLMVATCSGIGMQELASKSYKDIESALSQETSALEQKLLGEDRNALIAKILEAYKRRTIEKLYYSKIYNAVKGTPTERAVQAILDYLDSDEIDWPKNLPPKAALETGFAGLA